MTIVLTIDSWLGIWLRWLVYNLERFIRGYSSSQRRLGEHEAIHTLLTLALVLPKKDQWSQVVT